MAIRNFWVEADIDGRSTTLAGGPRSRTGGFELTVKVRDAGAIKVAAEVRGYANDDGKLTLVFQVHGRTETVVFDEGGPHSIDTNDGAEIKAIYRR